MSPDCSISISGRDGVNTMHHPSSWDVIWKASSAGRDIAYAGLKG